MSIEALSLQYEQGDEKGVWKTLKTPHFIWHDDYEALLSLMMKRIKFNLEVIHQELLAHHYTFFNFNTKEINQQPLILEQNDVNENISELEKQYEPFGYLPKLFSRFFAIIQEVNFIGYFDFDVSPHTLDALFIIPLDKYLLAKDHLVTTEYDFELKKDKHSLIFSPCDLHKINVSGQGSWTLAFMNTEQVDGKLHEFYKDITFLEYLRDIFQWGGLMGLEDLMNDNSIDTSVKNHLKHYLETVRKQLKPI